MTGDEWNVVYSADSLWLFLIIIIMTIEFESDHVSGNSVWTESCNHHWSGTWSGPHLIQYIIWRRQFMNINEHVLLLLCNLLGVLCLINISQFLIYISQFWFILCNSEFLSRNSALYQSSYLYLTVLNLFHNSYLYHSSEFIAKTFVLFLYKDRLQKSSISSSSCLSCKAAFVSAALTVIGLRSLPWKPIYNSASCWQRMNLHLQVCGKHTCLSANINKKHASELFWERV